MKKGMRFWRIGMALVLVAVLAGSAEAFTFIRLPPIQYTAINVVISDYATLRNILLNQNIAIGNKEVYWNQRMVGDAIVEGATTVVQFDPVALEYIELQSLRPDVVDSQILSPKFASGDVAGLVIGTFQKAQLYILQPGSAVFPVTSDPTHPSWVVYSSAGVDPDGNNQLVISIFDAVTGVFLGYGTPPPYTALSINGPDWGATFPSCDPIWHDWMMSAKNGFDDIGYSTEGIDVATEAQIQGHIQSSSTALFYELDHGGSTSFHNICPDSTGNIYATDVGIWISDYTKMPFAFIGSCGGLCSNGPGTFSYEFRKGDTASTAAVGYCHMDWTGSGSETYDCSQCWGNSIAWQDDLFDRLKNGETVQDAFDHALADYPMCGSGSTCMRLDGDPDLKLVPVVIRGSLPTANAGPDQTVEQTSKAGTSATLDGSASNSPNGATLTYAWSWTGGSATSVNPTASFPLGTTIVTLTVDDGYGSPLDKTQRSDTVSITVVDTTRPVFTTIPGAVTVEQTSAAGTPVTLVAAATDICDASPVITSNAPAVFPLGTTTVTFTATDASGNSSSGTTTVTVIDTTPPDISSVNANPSILWSPNHKMVPVTVAVSVTDICDAAPSCQIVSVSSNEPENGLGDGDTAPDWNITGNLRLNLRAERSGTGSGRFYTVTVRCTDASGNSATKNVNVTVPHNK
jgi:hypothetical protein